MDAAALIDALLAGDLTRDQVVEQLGADAGIEDLGYARLDKDRARRRGFPEVIYGPGKTPQQLVEIFDRLASRNPNVLATRVSDEAAALVCGRFDEARHDAGVVYLHRDTEDRGRGQVLVLSAGTSDQGPAREALVCARVLGNEAEHLADIGVAGLHRLLSQVDRIRRAQVIICVAGLEAALPSVVAGLVDCPVIAVPTSVGYGASFGGVAALLSCLNACSSGVVSVNIDNGFGAAYAATLMNRA